MLSIRGRVEYPSGILPKAYRFETDEVCVARVGEMVILYPRDKGWALLERGLKQFTEDFMSEREQPAADETRHQL